MFVYFFMCNFRRRPLFIALGLTLLVSACATHSGYETNADGSVEPYGFFSGIWHRIIFPFAVGLAILANIVVNALILILWILYLIQIMNFIVRSLLNLLILILSVNQIPGYSTILGT